MQTTRWNIKRISILCIAVLGVYVIFSASNNKYEVDAIIKHTKPEKVWEFVADFSKMKLLNPTIKNGPTPTGKVYESEHHNLQEYTYKKITPCDVCSQVLRGHTRQGLRCRICKFNVHVDCAAQLPKCQAKQKLLRRQKSTSEIDNRVDVEEEKPNDIDQIYRVLKQAGQISSNKMTDKPAANNGTTIATTTPAQQQEIPTLNVPECPERTVRRGQLKPQGQNTQVKTCLTAPVADVSSSVPIAGGPVDTGTRRKLFAGFRPLSAFARGRIRSQQHRSISLPENDTTESTRPFGQPLCLVAVASVSVAAPPRKGVRKKK